MIVAIVVFINISISLLSSICQQINTINQIVGWKLDIFKKFY